MNNASTYSELKPGIAFLIQGLGRGWNISSVLRTLWPLYLGEL